MTIQEHDKAMESRKVSLPMRRSLGWDDRDIPIDDAVCEIVWEEGEPLVRLCFSFCGVGYDIVGEDLPDNVRMAFENQA